MIRLLSIRPASDSKHKLEALFLLGNQLKTVRFGARGYEDFTTHQDPERQARYLKRHQAREHWQDPTTPGALSRWILWNKPTLKASILDFQQRFQL